MTLFDVLRYPIDENVGKTFASIDKVPNEILLTWYREDLDGKSYPSTANIYNEFRHFYAFKPDAFKLRHECIVRLKKRIFEYDPI